MPENWNIPSGPSRRDTEDMLAHVSRSESETNDLSRRIEEQLRGVARRLDAAERSQSENNRALSRAAAEINVATREQSQAFDQLGTHVVGLSDRLERVERHAGDSSMKDAVKGLHQGLSRLADQITQTANQSATQVSALAHNLEQLAARLSHTRQETETISRALEQRLAAVEKTAEGSSISLQERLAAVEKIAEGNTHTLERAIGAFEEGARNRASEQNTTVGAIARLEENIGALESRVGVDPMLDSRLNGIEHTLSEIVSRLDVERSNNPVEDSIRRLSQRLESVEKNYDEDVNELRAAVTQATSRLTAVETQATPFSGAAAASNFEPPPSAFEEPPFPEAAPMPPFEQPPHDPFALPPFETGEFGAENAFPPLVSDPFAPPPAPTSVDSYLAAARRSARAAAATADADRMRGPLGGFNWSGGQAPAAPGKSARSRYTLPGLAALVAVLVVALLAGIVLNKTPNQTAPQDMGAAFAPKTGNKTAAPATAMPPLGSLQPKSVAKPTQNPSQAREVKPAPTAAAPASAAKTQSAPATPPAAAQAAQQPKPAAPSPTTALDHLTALANNGDPTAEAIVGFRYRDGDGIPQNKELAAKWLERAAEQGQAVAQGALGKLYEDGDGVPKDAVKAVRWYQASAAQGNRIAMHNWALTFYNGVGQKKDLAEAARWFLNAAMLNLVDSQVNLAMLYEHGQGVPQSLLDAYKWYLIAAANGDSPSKQASDTLKTQLSPDDQAAAERSAASFHAKAMNVKANNYPKLTDLPK